MRRSRRIIPVVLLAGFLLPPSQAGARTAGPRCTRVHPGPAFPRIALIDAEQVRGAAPLVEEGGEGVVLLRRFSFPSGGSSGDFLQRATPNGEGELTFGEPSWIATRGYPRSVASGDFDGDHVTDVLILWQYGFDLAFYRGRADGGFDPPRIWKPSPRFDEFTPAVGDFDGDGKDEVALLLARYSSLQMLEIDESGGWELGVSRYFRGAPGELPVVDWNADGIDDLVVRPAAGWGDTWAHILFGDRGRPLHGQGWIYFPAPADELAGFNGELLTLEYDGAWPSRHLIRVTALDPDLYGTAPLWSIEPAANTCCAQTNLDLDGDGIDDLWLIGDGAAEVYWGEPGAAPRRGPSVSPGERLVAGMDLDGDGVRDLVSEEWAALIQRVNRQPVGGLFSTTVYEGFIDEPFVHLDIDDLNGDGLDDLVTQTFYGDSLSVCLSRGDGSFEVRPMKVDPRQFHYPEMVDIDADGALDLLATQDRRSVAWGRSDGTFEIALSSIGFGRRLHGELDGQPGEDLVELITDRRRQEIIVRSLLERGRGWIESGFESRYRRSRYADRATLADIDADGLDDLLLVRREETGAAIEWWRSSGDGSFAEPKTLVDGPSRACYDARLSVVDFDRDGTVDLFFQPGSSFGCNELPDTSLRGLGGERFEVIWQGPPTDTKYGLEDRLGDVDGDGRLDLIGGQYEPFYLPRHQVEIRRGDGLGGFLEKEPHVWRGPAGPLGVFRESGTRDLVNLKSIALGRGKINLELLPSTGYVLPEDAAPPEVELRLLPAGEGIYRPAFLPLDDCDSAPRRLGSRIALPPLDEGFLAGFESAPQREILTFESADGSRRGVLLRGPERGSMVSLLNRLLAAGGVPVRHMAPLALALEPEYPVLSQVALPGAHLLQRIEIGEDDHATAAEAFGPEADLIFVMEAGDKSGRVGRSRAGMRGNLRSETHPGPSGR